MKMSEKIFHCRQRAGLSQEALAERLGVSRQAVSRWECGETTPEPAKILLLARTFGVTADWLLDDAQTLAEPQTPDDAPVDPPAPEPPPTAPTRTVLIPPPKKRSSLATGIILICAGGACLLFFGVVYLLSLRFISVRVLNNLFFPLAMIALGGGIGLIAFGVIYVIRALRKK